MDFGTLFEDDDVLVLAKPSGLPVLPGGFFLENTLLHRVRERYGACLFAAPPPRPRHVRGHPLHPQPPGGALAGRAMFERRILKVYLALASGTSMPDAFTVDAPIGPVPHTLPATVNAYHPGGRPSSSHVRVLRRFPDMNASLLEVTIPTGRPHQIRIHLASRDSRSSAIRSIKLAGFLAPTASTTNGRRPPARRAISSTPGRSAFPILSVDEDVEVVCPPPAALDPGR